MWSPTLLLSISAGFVTLGFLACTLPYLCIGPFTFYGYYQVTSATAFLAAFAFRYWRLAVHIVSYFLHRSAPPAANPKYTGKDVTVILPTLQPSGQVFRKCVETIAFQQPAAFYIVVPEDYLLSIGEKAVAGLRIRYPGVDLQVHSARVYNKRIQIDHVIPRIQTDITILVDDHVFFGQAFFKSVLAGFEDDGIGLVGVDKRVSLDRRPGPIWAAFWNFLGCVYLERHNFEIAATTTIDGGVFAVSGRTLAIRSHILQDEEFRQRYLNERITLFNWMSFGPLAADDDNFITRFIAERELGIKIQFDASSTIETPLGEYPKFMETCFRWARTTFRSNPRSLAMATIWRNQPWSVYAVYLAGITNFAAVWDPLLVYLLRQTPACAFNPSLLYYFLAFVICTKLIKLIPFYSRHPGDIVFFPFYILVAYLHSLIKMWSLMTFYDIEWSGRNIPRGPQKGGHIDKKS